MEGDPLSGHSFWMRRYSECSPSIYLCLQFLALKKMWRKRYLGSSVRIPCLESLLCNSVVKRRPWENQCMFPSLCFPVCKMPVATVVITGSLCGFYSLCSHRHSHRELENECTDLGEGGQGEGWIGRFGIDVCAVPPCVCSQSCLTLCDPMDSSPPGSSVHGTFLARILEWVAISFSRASSWLRDQTCLSHISCIAGRFFTTGLLGRPRMSTAVC